MKRDVFLILKKFLRHGICFLYPSQSYLCFYYFQDIWYANYYDDEDVYSHTNM